MFDDLKVCKDRYIIHDSFSNINIYVHTPIEKFFRICHIFEPLCRVKEWKLRGKHYFKSHYYLSETRDIFFLFQNHFKPPFIVGVIMYCNLRNPENGFEMLEKILWGKILLLDVSSLNLSYKNKCYCLFRFFFFFWKITTGIAFFKIHSLQSN